MSTPRDSLRAGRGPAPDDGGAETSPPLLRVRDLRVVFRGRGRPVVAVDGVSFDVRAGETLGLVGESGSGKSTVGRAVVGLVQPEAGAIEIAAGGEEAAVQREAGRDRRAGRRARPVQMVFQDPGGSLNPRMRIWRTVAEPLEVHERVRGRALLRKRAADALRQCGLDEGSLDRFPHELSGGQRQRVAIARALAVRPRLLICDEPTSALDVSVQAQVLNLLRDLQGRFGLAYLFISHDVGVIEHMSDRIAVMHHGRILETGPRDRVLRQAEAAYTRELLAAAPRVEG